MKKVAIYIRVSTDEQAKEGFSIPAQRHKLMSYAGLNDWDIFDLYIDEGWSGAKIERPELNRLREDMNIGKFDLVLVWRVDRFFRNVYYLSTLLHEMEQKKIGFKSMTESFDTSNPSGKAMLHMLAIFAEWERDTIRERIMNALDERARQGLHHGQAPFGYERDGKGKLVIIPEQAEVVKRLFYLRSKSHSFNEIADDLIKKFGLARLGMVDEIQVVWFIQRLIANPVYHGNIQRNGEIFPGEHEPIIDESISKLIESQKGTRSDDHFYIFKGLLHCGECGARMRCKSKVEYEKRSYFYYCPHSKSLYSREMKRTGHCPGRQVREHLAVDHVRKVIQDIQLNFIKDHAEKEEEILRSTDQHQTYIQQLNQRIEELRKRKNRYFLMFEEDVEFEQEAKERIREISKQIQELQIEKQELEEANQQVASTQEFDIEAFKEILTQVDDAVKDYDREQLREIFLILFNKLTVKSIPGVKPAPGRSGSYLEAVWN